MKYFNGYDEMFTVTIWPTLQTSSKNLLEHLQPTSHQLANFGLRETFEKQPNLLFFHRLTRKDCLSYTRRQYRSESQEVKWNEWHDRHIDVMLYRGDRGSPSSRCWWPRPLSRAWPASFPGALRSGGASVNRPVSTSLLHIITTQLLLLNNCL